ncbi:MAG: hypothetical protein IJW48_05010 [Clostridia bacterium]|nr:hypothetical protein [Clostridia bacterium]
MKKILLTLILTLLLAATLTSCGSDSEVPEGMQLVYGSDVDGYYFYGPEEWVVANQADIKCTYVSSVDYSSVTFVKSELPEPSVPDLSEAARVKEYFTASTEKLASAPFSDFTLSEIQGESCDFGNADRAYKFVYSYTYGDKPYKAMQIFVLRGTDFYIFTFNSSTKEYTKDDGSYYQFYLTNKVQPIIENFTFVEKTEASEAPVEYETDSKGNILVSDKAVSGFKLWVSPEYTPDYSSGIVSVSREDGANIVVSELVDSTISIKDNYLQRRDKLTALADKKADGTPDFTEIKGVTTNGDGEEALHILELENARSAAEFEYTYTLFGTTYHVYQVFIVNGYINMEAYVFTFTCPEEHYAERIDEAVDVLKGMEF